MAAFLGDIAGFQDVDRNAAGDVRHQSMAANLSNERHETLQRLMWQITGQFNPPICYQYCQTLEMVLRGFAGCIQQIAGDVRYCGGYEWAHNRRGS
jgi:hypothetical protein